MPYLSAHLSTVVVFDEQLYRPGGMVHRWMTGMTHEFERHAKRYAPERSGELRAGITSGAEPVGPHQMRGTIASNAPYSLFVLFGTGYPVKGRAGSIFSTKGWKAQGNINAAYRTLWGSIDPKTGKFTRRRIPGVPRYAQDVALKGYWLAFGPDEYGPHVVAFEVSGQESNNFLFRAWNATARNHSSIRGIAPFGG